MERSRIALLRSRIHSLPLDGHSRAVLLKSIDYFGDQIIARACCARRTGGDKPDALPHTALSGMMERALHEKFSG